MREPQVFLMDERLSNLDAKPRVQMRIHFFDPSTGVAIRD